MAHQMVTILMILSDLQSHVPNPGLLKCNCSYSCADFKLQCIVQFCCSSWVSCIL